MSNARTPHTPADGVAEASVLDTRLIGENFREFRHYSVALKHDDGSEARLSRDLVHAGHVVGVLAVDLARDEVVLIRQFRLAAHLRTGRGDLVEIIAGFIDPGESAADAARRECHEEIGVRPTALRELFTFMPSPGILDEHATVFLAAVDAAQVPERAGAAHETEHTRPLRVAIDDAIAALAQGQIQNGYLILALQWLALNRHHLAALLAQT
jgi:ADP-ribose pyrophosphatase